MNDRRPGPGGLPAADGPRTAPSTQPVTGPLDAAHAPVAAPTAANGKAGITRPMAAHPPPAVAAGAIITHRATQMSASVGVPSTLESPKDPMLLRAEAQTRIELPSGSGHPSAVPSTLEDVDSTMPDNAARDAAIRDAARDADERAGRPSGSKQFGPPTLPSPNDGALPSTPPASLGGLVVDAILPSAAFARPEPPPTAPTHGSSQAPHPGTAGWGAMRSRPTVGGPGRGGPLGHSGTAAMMAPQGHAAAAGGLEVGAAAYPTANPAAIGAHGAGSGVPILPGTGGGALGSAPPGAYPHSVRASSPRGAPSRRPGATLTVVVIIAVVSVVVAITGVAVAFMQRARPGLLPPGAATPSATASASDGKRPR